MCSGLSSHLMQLMNKPSQNASASPGVPMRGSTSQVCKTVDVARTICSPYKVQSVEIAQAGVGGSRTPNATSMCAGSRCDSLFYGGGNLQVQRAMCVFSCGKNKKEDKKALANTN